MALAFADTAALPAVEEATTRAGVPVLCCRRDSPTAAAALFIRCGSRHDPPGGAGATHLLEHLLLREDGRAGFPQLIERLGGEANGFTGKEELVIYCRVPSLMLREALALLVERVLLRRLPQALFEAERRVVLEELEARRSDPAEEIHALLYQQLFPGDGLANPIGGNPEEVADLDVQTMTTFRDEHVHRETIGFVTVAPAHIDDVRDTLDQTAINTLPPGPWAPVSFPPQPGKPGLAVRTIASDYAYVAFAFPGHSYVDPRRAAADVLAMLIGGSSTSLLYEQIRSRLGLAYMLGCAHRCYSDTGVLRAVAGVSPSNVHTVIAAVQESLAERAETGWDEDEVKTAKEQCRGQLLLEAENSAELAAVIGRNRLSGRMTLWDPHIHLQALSDVSATDVQSLLIGALHTGVRISVAGGVTEELAL